MRQRTLLITIAAVLVVIATLFSMVAMLPPAPISPTPTWPLGVDLPNTLHRIVQP
jgi:hypothetical protein